MFDDLNKLLSVESMPLDRQRFVHISSSVEESGIANSSFLVHHFISSFVRKGYKVLLVGCLQTLSQYKIIENKLGVNLDQAIAQGIFSFISALNLCTSVVQEDGATCYGTSLNDMCNILLEEIKSKLNENDHKDDTPYLIIFDDLSTLTDLGVKTVDVLNMIGQVKSLYPHTFSTYLTSCSRLDANKTSVDSCSLSNQLTHWSDLTLAAHRLTTGLSKDVHGQLKVSRRSNTAVGHRSETYHYKVTERSLKLFAVGESPAVL